MPMLHAVRSLMHVDIVQAVVANRERAHASPVAGLRLWSQLCHLTTEGSARLCETLRLVLAPTLATRLQGDYKTGKRINMRKVRSQA